MIEKKILQKLYIQEDRSMQDIADSLGCSLHKVQYWMNKHSIPRRSIGDAVYKWHHPDGDPFKYSSPKTKEDYKLYGLGLGLYWGEGTKASKTSVRLGNTDPALIEQFMEFLMRFFSLQKTDFQFGLQIFSDIDPDKALDFWTKRLKISKHQFYKVTTTISGSIGTYRKKSKYGVLTIYYNNRKVRDILHCELAAVASTFAKASVDKQG